MIKVLQLSCYLDFCLLLQFIQTHETPWPNFIQFLNASTPLEGPQGSRILGGFVKR